MTYQIINEVLERLDADIRGAEAHGIATGMLCMDETAEPDTWLRELTADETEMDADDQLILSDFFILTRKSLYTTENLFSFDLLIAGDDEALHEQAESLRAWCQGFLFGIGFACSSDHEWPGEVGEIITDMIELTKIDCDIAGEEDEVALTEIREYVRAAVLTVKDQLSDANSAISH